MEPQQVGPSRFPWRGWHSSRAALEGVGQRQLCALLQLSRCRGPVEITVKFNLHISQSWARWLLLERLIPSDERLWKPKKYPHPPPLSTGLPKILPSCLFTARLSLLYVRTCPAPAFLQAHGDCWLWKVVVAGFHFSPGTTLRPGTEVAALGKWEWRRQGELWIRTSVASSAFTHPCE